MHPWVLLRIAIGNIHPVPGIIPDRDSNTDCKHLIMNERMSPCSECSPADSEPNFFIRRFFSKGDEWAKNEEWTKNEWRMSENVRMRSALPVYTQSNYFNEQWSGMIATALKSNLKSNDTYAVLDEWSLFCCSITSIDDNWRRLPGKRVLRSPQSIRNRQPEHSLKWVSLALDSGVIWWSSCARVVW